MTSRRSEVSAVVEEDSILLMIPIQYVDKWIIEFPTWKSLIFKTYQNRFNDLLLTIDSIAFRKVDERLLEYLERKARVLKSNIINAKHEEIANELNTSREVVSRLLKQLERMGKVKLGRNRIEMLNNITV
ncbi:MAG: Crp/Fnr family transcriptional regulator, partial [Bacteroidia bacterium]